MSEKETKAPTLSERVKALEEKVNNLTIELLAVEGTNELFRREVLKMLGRNYE